jgi:hypothetical protein
MAKKVKRKTLILIALLLANVVGYFAATTYFKDANQQNMTSTMQSTQSIEAPKTYFKNTIRLFGKGLEILRHFTN